MNRAGIPAPLFQAVASDLKPVRPLASPARRALALLPIGALLLFGFPELWSWRHHTALAPSPAWALSALETLLSLPVLMAAFREAVPGRRLSGRAITALVLIACATFLLVNLTLHRYPGASEAQLLKWFYECITTALTWSVPALVAPAWLVARALPGRPGLTGALCGLGTGLMADAGMRLICWDGDYAHVLVAHGGAIMVLVGLGALSGNLVEAIKVRRLQQMSA